MNERARERELLLAWRDGDRKAGEALVRTHAHVLQRFFSNKLSDPELVEELAQDTFAACVQGVERFRGDSNFRTWLFGVATNVLREHFRTRRREQNIDFGSVSVADMDDRPSAMLASSREQQRLLAALRRLSIDGQVLLELYYWESLTAPELAEALDIPVGTVRSRLLKAKLELRAALDSMERTREHVPTTEAQLDDWAREIRERLNQT